MLLNKVIELINEVLFTFPLYDINNFIRKNWKNALLKKVIEYINEILNQQPVTYISPRWDIFNDVYDVYNVYYAFMTFKLIVSDFALRTHLAKRFS